MWQVIGQDRILSLFDHGLRANAIAHAYLLVGPRHVGKGTLALDIARAMNCNASEVPCGQCTSCQRVSEGKHADVTCTQPESGTEIGIDDIRALQRLANLPPYEGKCKVFIIDEAEYLSTEAANAILKILEEPPQNVVWLLLTSEEERILPTVVSRCQRLELRPLPPEQAQQVLIDLYRVDPDKARSLSLLCRGCLGWALKALSDDDILEQRSQGMTALFSLLTASLGHRFGYAQELAGQFIRDRRTALETLAVWLDWWRDLMLIKGGCGDAVTNTEHAAALEQQAQELNLADITGFLSALCLLQSKVSKNVNPRLALESLMLDLPKSARVGSRERALHGSLEN